MWDGGHRYCCRRRVWICGFVLSSSRYAKGWLAVDAKSARGVDRVTNRRSVAVSRA